MKAIVQERYGSPDALHLREVEQPVPDDGQILVRVRAAAVNAYDWHFMRGDPYFARASMGLRGPNVKIRGRDFAGEVVAVGAEVTRFAVGDEVYGEVNGAFAEYVVARNNVAHKPANLTFEQAAAVPLAGNTALIGLRDVAKLAAGQRLLVNGASGGVGTFAVQLGKVYGAHVTAVCSTRNADLVSSLGADRVVDYTREDVTKADYGAAGSRYDVVLDLVGNHSLGALRRTLTPTGTLILSGGGNSQGGAMFGPYALILRGQLVARFAWPQRIAMLPATPSPENLATLRELIESGKVSPVIDRTFPLSDTAEAIRYVETEHARAKVVITVP